MGTRTAVEVPQKLSAAPVSELLRHTAVRSAPMAETLPTPAIQRDFSRVRAQMADPLTTTVSQTAACPLFPRRCPFGGACHACPARIQTKLTINQPGDKYEQEADRIASQIMRMPEPKTKLEEGQTTQVPTPSVNVQRRETSQTMPIIAPPIVQEVLASPGRPLDPATRAYMEPRFGQEFSQVRVHAGPQADKSAQVINALAYTVGDDIVFGAGQYGLQTRQSRQLAAHELVHVLQQRLQVQQTNETQIFCKEENKPQDEAEILIKKHKGFWGLDEQALGEDLLKRLPNESQLILKVLDKLPSWNKDDVSLAVLEMATDEQIKLISADKGGRAALLRMVQELQFGPTFPDEQKQIQRVMAHVTEVAPAKPEGSEKGTGREVEVITFKTGSMDWLAKLVGMKAKGHTAIIIGGYAYSFEWDWRCGQTKEEFMKANEHRDGVGQVLNILSDDVVKLQKKLNKSCSTGIYLLGGDICSDATARALETVFSGLKSGWDPQTFEKDIDKTGTVKTKRSYPKKPTKKSEAKATTDAPTEIPANSDIATPIAGVEMANVVGITATTATVPTSPTSDTLLNEWLTEHKNAHLSSDLTWILSKWPRGGRINDLEAGFRTDVQTLLAFVTMTPGASFNIISYSRSAEKQHVMHVSQYIRKGWINYNLYKFSRWPDVLTNGGRTALQSSPQPTRTTKLQGISNPEVLEIVWDTGSQLSSITDGIRVAEAYNIGVNNPVANGGTTYSWPTTKTTTSKHGVGKAVDASPVSLPDVTTIRQNQAAAWPNLTTLQQEMGAENVTVLPASKTESAGYRISGLTNVNKRDAFLDFFFRVRSANRAGFVDPPHFQAP